MTHKWEFFYNPETMEQDWRPPFPKDQLDVRVMCGDPVAVAIDVLDKWRLTTRAKDKITLAKLLRCLWDNHNAGRNADYVIRIDDLFFPHELPNDVWDAVVPVIFKDYPK